MKQFSTKNKVGENKGTYVIYQLHHNYNLISPVVVELNWYKNQAYVYNERSEFDDRMIKNFTSKNRNNNGSDGSVTLINQDIVGTNVTLNLKGDIYSNISDNYVYHDVHFNKNGYKILSDIIWAEISDNIIKKSK